MIDDFADLEDEDLPFDNDPTDEMKHMDAPSSEKNKETQQQAPQAS